jgi:hypothetical protein
MCDYRDAMWLAHSVGRGKTKIDAELGIAGGFF